MSRLSLFLGCVLAAAAVVPSGCKRGAGEQDDRARRPGPGEVHLNNYVVVIFEDGRRKLPFDVREIRLKKATEQLGQLMGHRIEFNIRRAVMPQYEEQFEDLLIDAIETVARDAKKVSKRHSDVPELLDALVRVDVRYDASRERRWGRGRDWEFDLATKTLTVRTGGYGGGFVPEGAVYRALADARSDVLAAKFSGASAKRIKPGDQAGYLEQVVAGFKGPYKDDDATAADLDAHPDLEKLARVRELYPDIGDPDLKQEAGHWLADSGGKLFYGHLDRAGAAVAKVDPRGAYGSERRAWASWIRDNLWTLDEPKRERLLEEVLPQKPRELAIPGLAPMDFGFLFVDRWIATGREGPNRNVMPGTTLNQVVCPVDLELTERLPFRSACRQRFYRNVWTTEKSKRAFVARLVKRDDVALYRAATAAIHKIDGTDGVMDLWRRVGRRDKAWTAVGTELAALEVGADLVDPLQAMWRKQPKRRATLLYILAMDHRSGYRLENFWTHFKEDFGPVDARTFAAFLDHGPHAVALSWVVWPALSSFDRGSAIARHLDALFDAGKAKRFEHQGFKQPVEVMAEVVAKMCSAGSATERRSLEAALRRRSKRHSDEAKDLAVVLRRTRC